MGDCIFKDYMEVETAWETMADNTGHEHEQKGWNKEHEHRYDGRNTDTVADNTEHGHHGQ